MGVCEYAIDKDICPDNDAVIARDMCKECQYYRGFDLYMKQQPCICCAYYEQSEK